MSLFNVFKNNEAAKKRSYIKNLNEVAVSDVQLDDREFDLIAMIAEKFGITKTDTIEITEDLVKVLLVDKVIEEDEIKVCKEFSKKFRLNSFDADDLINSNLNQF